MYRLKFYADKKDCYINRLFCFDSLTLKDVYVKLYLFAEAKNTFRSIWIHDYSEDTDIKVTSKYLPMFLNTGFLTMEFDKLFNDRWKQIEMLRQRVDCK